MVVRPLRVRCGVGNSFAKNHRQAALLEEEGSVVQLCLVAYGGIPLAKVFRETHGGTEAQRVMLVTGIHGVDCQ